MIHFMQHSSHLNAQPNDPSFHVMQTALREFLRVFKCKLWVDARQEQRRGLCCCLLWQWLLVSRLLKQSYYQYFWSFPLIGGWGPMAPCGEKGFSKFANLKTPEALCVYRFMIGRSMHMQRRDNFCRQSSKPSPPKILGDGWPSSRHRVCLVNWFCILSSGTLATNFSSESPILVWFKILPAFTHFAARI